MQKEVFSHFNFSERGPIKILDLGAGSGVIALELAKSIPTIQLKQIDLIELQGEFIPHIKQNIEACVDKNKIRIFQGSHFDFPFCGQYDLIICNPPYFFAEAGRLPNSPNRKICEFYKAGDRERLLNIFTRGLRKSGAGHILQSNKNSLRSDLRIC